ncbi:gamma-glutamyl-gamma-aminobutyrate hydrolase family protein [Candidatus Bipolaricaulota bacterium]|nr:gamma-glutamyl-gamma-aminobutyrate hydrolase family protein [Candidatus Bipolaricaulota bacterium]
MGSKPKIALTCSFDESTGTYKIHRDYVEAVAASGGRPYVLPALSGSGVTPGKVLEEVDGLLFSGGTDLDPRWFDQEPRYEFYNIVPERDSLEVELAKKAREVNLPVLGLCRGIQVINIAAGGSIYQDIDGQVKKCLNHSQNAPRWYPTHRIDVRPGTMLEEILEVRKLRVNSFHHQAIQKVANEFRTSATSDDGIIEGLEPENGGVQLGVQWHPERMWRKYPVHKNLFDWLVKKAKK